MRRAEGTEVSRETWASEQDLDWRSGSGLALSCLEERDLAPPPCQHSVLSDGQVWENTSVLILQLFLRLPHSTLPSRCHLPGLKARAPGGWLCSLPLGFRPGHSQAQRASCPLLSQSSQLWSFSWVTQELFIQICVGGEGVWLTPGVGMHVVPGLGRIRALPQKAMGSPSLNHWILCSASNTSSENKQVREKGSFS